MQGGATTMTNDPRDGTIRAADERAEHRRELLHATILDLQGTLDGDDAPATRATLVAALDRAAKTVGAHVLDAEETEGLLADVVRAEPGFSARVEGMHREHQVILEEIDALLQSPSDRPLEDLASAVRGLIDLLDSHRHRSAELLLDAYSLDLSAGE